MLRHEHLVVLAERIWFPKKVLVEGHASFGDVEHFNVVDVLYQRFPGVDSHKWISLCLPLVVVKWACNNRVQVGRYFERIAEKHLFLVRRLRFGLFLEQRDSLAAISL